MQSKDIKTVGFAAIIILLGIGVIVLLAGSSMSRGKITQLKQEVSQLNQMMQQKDIKMNLLTGQLTTKQKDNDNMKSQLEITKAELDKIKTDIEGVTKKIDTSAAKPVTP